MRVVRIEDKLMSYDNEGRLIFFGSSRTFISWIRQTERNKLGSDKKIHGIDK